MTVKEMCNRIFDASMKARDCGCTETADFLEEVYYELLEMEETIKQQKKAIGKYEKRLGIKEGK